MSEETILVPLETELDAFFAQYTASDQARGLVYGLANEDGLAHWTGFGVANDDGLVPDADTVFPIASMSKSFVACAALIARDRGYLSLTDSITAHVPEFAMSGEGVSIESPPTIEMLFSMCGGLTEDNSWVDPFIDLPIESLLTQVSRGVRFSHYPGAEYEYSNLGFALAGLAVSRAVGRPLEDYVRDVLFTPLGLTSTFFDSAVPAGFERATGYSLDTNGHWVPFPPQASDAFAPAGGIMSTVRDLATWITWLGSAFRPPRGDDPNAVLSRTSRRELQRIPCGGAAGAHCRRQRLDPVGRRGLRARAPGNDRSASRDVSLPRRRPARVQAVHDVAPRIGTRGGRPHQQPPGRPDRSVRRGARAGPVPARGPRLDGGPLAGDRGAAGPSRGIDPRLGRRAGVPVPRGQRRLRPPAVGAPRRDRAPRRGGRPARRSRPRPEIVSAVTPADVTWSIPGLNGELLCMIHLTPVEPVQVQELVVKAFPADRPRGRPRWTSRPAVPSWARRTSRRSPMCG